MHKMVSLIQYTRDCTHFFSLVTQSFFQITSWYFRVTVDKSVGFATCCLCAFITTIVWLLHIHRLDIVSIEIHTGDLFGALFRGWHALVKARVPWHAIEFVRAALNWRSVASTCSILGCIAMRRWTRWWSSRWRWSHRRHHTGDDAFLGLFRAEAFLEITSWATRIIVHKCIRFASCCLDTFVAAVAWLVHIRRLDIIAVKIDVRVLLLTLLWRVDALVVTSVPRLAVLALCTAFGIHIGISTVAPWLDTVWRWLRRWCSRRRSCWCFQDTRYNAEACSLLAPGLLQVADGAVWVLIDVGVKQTAVQFGAGITAVTWLAHTHSHDILGVDIDIDQLTLAFGWQVDALCIPSVPWLAVLTLRTAIGVFGTVPPRWKIAGLDRNSSSCYKRSCHEQDFHFD